jgi:hypothetical protein
VQAGFGNDVERNARPDVKCRPRVVLLATDKSVNNSNNALRLGLRARQNCWNNEAFSTTTYPRYPMCHESVRIFRPLTLVHANV